jgi:O-antigen/teichoic acid export membrane protein
MNLTSIKDFKNIFQALWVEDSFKRNLAVTFSGQAFGQVVGFLFTPFIARAYGPESYGVFSLFMAIAANLSSVSTLQLPTGYVSARNHRELHILLQVTFICLIVSAGTSAIVIGFFKHRILNALDATSLTFLIYFVPIYVLFMGLDYILLGWNIYLKEFGRGAIAKVSSIVVSKSATLLYGMLVASSALGLIIGNFLIYPIESTIKFSKKIRHDFASIVRLGTWKEFKSVFRRYRSYPLFVTPGLLVTSINGQLPVYLFSIYFENAFVGLFALASSVVTVPISVITNSTTTVFLQKAAETQRNNYHLLKDLVLALHKRLFLICFIPLSVFAFFSDWIFVVVFGADWQQAGWIAAFLAVSTILTVPHQPLSVLFRLMNKEHNNLLLSIISIGLRVIGLSIGIYYDDIKLAVAGYAAASILTTSLSLGLIFSIVKIKVSILSWYVLAVLAIFTLLILEKF